MAAAGRQLPRLLAVSPPHPRSRPPQTAECVYFAPIGISLGWATTEELDNDFFTIEHSTDGLTFMEIATIAGAGTTDKVAEYAYTVADPAPGVHYYRLVQQDYDGTRTTYKVVTVTVGEAAALGRPYPNPARAGDRVTFQAAEGVKEISLHSITGRLVKRYATTGTVDLPTELAAGVYLLRAGETTTRLLVR